MSNFAGHCAVCLNQQMLDARKRMVLHGYRRPGTGYITANCPGVKYPAWEISPEGAIHYLGMLRSHLRATQDYLAKLEAGEITSIYVLRAPTYEERAARGLRTGQSTIGEEIGTNHPKWRQALDSKIKHSRDDISRTIKEISELEPRIAAWKPGTLIPVEEIERQEQAARVVTMTFDPGEAMWSAKSQANKTIAQHKTVAAVVAELKRKGWSVQAGDLPQDIPMSAHLAKLAAQPVDPKKKKISITSKLEPVSARALLVAYETMTPELKAEFDITGTKHLYDRVRYAIPTSWEPTSRGAYDIDVNKLRDELVGEFTRRIEWRQQRQQRRR